MPGRRAFALPLIGAMFAPRTARAAGATVEESRFARAGQLVLPQIVGVSSSMRIGSSTEFDGLTASGLFSIGSSASLPTLTVAFRPRADFFVVDGWSVGLGIDLAYTTKSDFAARTFSLAVMPRVGRAFRIGPVTFWPNLGFGYGRAWRTVSQNAWIGDSFLAPKTISVFADLDVVVPITNRLIIDIAPTFAYRDPPGTNFGEFGLRAHLGLMF